MSSGERVLIVVPCLDEERHLPGLLDRLAADNPAALIVVADGGSTDRSREIVRSRRGVALLDNPKRRQGAGVNLAAERFGEGCTWLARIDAHCGYPGDYVGRLISAAARRGADSVVVPMRTVGEGCFQRAAAIAQNSLLGTGGSAHRLGGRGQFVDHGHHALMRLALFRQIGGYDESFTHNEDAELDHRLTSAGGRIWLEPDAAIDYWPRATIGALWRQYQAYGRGRARTVAKHRLTPRLRQRIPLAVAPALLLAAIGAAAATLATPAALLALPAFGWAAICLCAGAWEALRRRDRCAALTGVALMTMHLGWSSGYWRQTLGRRRASAEGS